MHVAADYRLWIRDPDTMYRANVDGTRDLLTLAREARCRRFVYTSSVATMAFRTDGIVVNEDTPVSINDMVGHYKRSKFLAEQQAIAAAEDGQQVMILNPTTPIGPTTPSPRPPAASSSTSLTTNFLPTSTLASTSSMSAEVAPHPCRRADRSRQARPSLHPRWRKPHPQADPRQDVSHHRHPLADHENSFRRRRHLRLL